MSRTQQQWVTVVNSWQNKSRYKCGIEQHNLSALLQSTQLWNEHKIRSISWSVLSAMSFLGIALKISLCFKWKIFLSLLVKFCTNEFFLTLCWTKITLMRVIIDQQPDRQPYHAKFLPEMVTSMFILIRLVKTGHDLNNYRPVSNLCFIAKILEKLVLSQDSSYLNSHNIYNTCQSAYRPGHSTETALLKVANDLFLSLNKGNISVLALLDFSSAFDTIDHTILVHRLHTDFGFTDTVLQWFSSYLTDRTHYVSLSNHCSAFAPVHSGVPHGSVLGPILFTMYIKPLSAIIGSHSIIHHSFTDDLQLQMSAPPDRISELLHSIQSCISDVKAWATANMLKFNDNKSELILVSSKRAKHLHKLPTSSTIGNAQIPFKQSLKNFGSTLDSHLLLSITSITRWLVWSKIVGLRRKDGWFDQKIAGLRRKMVGLVKRSLVWEGKMHFAVHSGMSA